MPYVRPKRRKIRKKDVKLFLILVLVALGIGAFISLLEGGFSSLFRNIEEEYIMKAAMDATARDAGQVRVFKITDGLESQPRNP